MNGKLFALGLGTVVVGAGVSALGALSTKYAIEGVAESVKSPVSDVKVLDVFGLVTGPMCISTGINMAGFGITLCLSSKS